MKLTTFDIYEYNLPLTQPLSLEKEKIQAREGIIIHLKSDHGGDGLGEIAPLPGFSLEDLTQCLGQIKFLRLHLINQPIPPHLEQLNGEFKKWVGQFKLQPSVQCGFEMAMLNLIASIRHKPVYELISKDHHSQIEINGFLKGSPSTVIQEAKQLITQGFRSIKLKIGDDDVEKDVDTVRKIADATEEKALIRLDANQKWTMNQAVHFALEVGFPAIEYIEEPFKDISLISEFFMKTTIPVALDESLTDHTITDVKSIDGMEVVVLKPTILGGFEKCWQMMQEARAHGLRSVISSTFESGIGILALANLAACNNKYSAAGLDTLKWIKDDLLKAPLKIEHGKMDITSKTLSPNDIHFDHLKLI